MLTRREFTAAATALAVGCPAAATPPAGPTRTAPAPWYDYAHATPLADLKAAYSACGGRRYAGHVDVALAVLSRRQPVVRLLLHPATILAAGRNRNLTDLAGSRVAAAARRAALAECRRPRSRGGPTTPLGAPTGVVGRAVQAALWHAGYAAVLETASSRARACPVGFVCAQAGTTAAPADLPAYAGPPQRPTERRAVFEPLACVGYRAGLALRHADGSWEDWTARRDENYGLQAAGWYEPRPPAWTHHEFTLLLANGRDTAATVLRVPRGSAALAWVERCLARGPTGDGFADLPAAWCVPNGVPPVCAA